MERRKFLQSSIIAGAGVFAAVKGINAAPIILTSSRVHVNTEKGELIFRPYFVQNGRGPHLLDWAYASDENWDAFFQI